MGLLFLFKGVDNMATWQDTLKKIQQEALNSGGNSSATYNSELARANKVLAERKAQGLDTSSQETYLKQLNQSYNTGKLQGQASAVGANPNNIDMGYVQAMSSNTVPQYVDNVLSGKVTPQPSGVSQSSNVVSAQGVIPSATKAYSAPVATQPVQATAQPTQTAYKAPDFTKQVNDIYNPLISSNLASLKAAYDKARSDITAQTPQIQQDARTARTSNETDYIKSLPELYRAMEAAGQKGGQNITGNIALQTTRGQNLGQINQTEMNNLAALQKAIADLNAEQPLKEQSVQQQLQSDQAKALMDANQYGLDYALKMADLTGNVEVSPGVSVPTLQAQQYLTNKALQEAGLTGTYNGQSTLAAQQQASNQAMNEASLTGTYKGQQTLAAKQQELDNLYRQQTFDYTKSRDAVSDTQWQQTMNLNLRQQSFNEAQQKIENALSQKRISQEDASQALQWAKYNAEKDPTSLDNQIKSAQLSGLNLSNTQTELENKNLQSGLTASGGQPSGGTTATEQKYAEEVKLAAVLDSKPTVEEKVKWIQANKANIIATFGKSYYDNLLSNPY
jgi:hypothetical protein